MWNDLVGYLIAACALGSIGAAQPLKTAYGVVPPLSFNNNGKPAGFTIDAIDEAARREGLKLEWVFGGPSLQIETSLSSGALDIVPAGMVTPERREMFFLSDPWWFAELSLMTKERGDGPGRSIGLGSPIYRGLAEKAFPAVPQVPFPDAVQAAAALCRGDVDSALLMHMDVHRVFLYHPREADACRVAAVKVSETRANVELAIMARRGMERPAQRLRRRIDEMALDGTLARLAARYPDIPSSGVVKLAGDLRVRYARQRVREVVIAAALLALVAALFVRRLLRDFRAQRRAQARLERAHRIASLGDWELDLASRRLFLSQSARGFCCGAPEKPVGLDVFLSCVAAEDADRVRSAIEQAGSGNGADISYAIDHPELGRRYVRLNAEPVSGAGRGASVVGAIQDLTEHRKLEEQLRQAQKMETVGQLAGGVAHDFNNLLTVIGGYAGMVLDASAPGDPVREPVATIVEAADRAAALTRQLLAFSRRQRVELKVLSLNELLRNLEKMLRRLIGEDIELLVDLDPETPPILADAGQIEQVVTNLVLNARDAMPDGGRIVVRTAKRRLVRSNPSPRQGDRVELTVVDTGSGMSPDIVSRIFEPFFTTKAQGKGTGLGLSIVYGIVKQSDGTIEVRSEPGHGTAFEILFPAAETASLDAGPDRAPAETSAPGSETVLVAEDEPGVRAFVGAILRSNGYRVMEARNGREALAVAAEGSARIDLLLTDVIMPEMGGIELAERLSALLPGVPVLFMSGYTDRAVSVPVAEKLLNKPFRAGDLLRHVKESLPPHRDPAANAVPAGNLPPASG